MSMYSLLTPYPLILILGFKEGAVENLGPSIPVPSDLRSQIAGWRGAKRLTFGLPHPFQKTGLVFEQKKIFPAVGRSLSSGIDHSEHKLHLATRMVNQILDPERRPFPGIKRKGIPFRIESERLDNHPFFLL